MNNLSFCVWLTSLRAKRKFERYLLANWTTSLILFQVKEKKRFLKKFCLFLFSQEPVRDLFKWLKTHYKCFNQKSYRHTASNDSNITVDNWTLASPQETSWDSCSYFCLLVVSQCHRISVCCSKRRVSVGTLESPFLVKKVLIILFHWRGLQNPLFLTYKENQTALIICARKQFIWGVLLIMMCRHKISSCNL